MIVDIFPGSHFSRLKLLFGTNKYFHSAIFNRSITNPNSNYAIKIGKHSVKIILFSKFSENDINKIKKYIETVFRNKSILIDSTDEIHWINDIKNVSIYTLDSTNDERYKR